MHPYDRTAADRGCIRNSCLRRMIYSRYLLFGTALYIHNSSRRHLACLVAHSFRLISLYLPPFNPEIKMFYIFQHVWPGQIRAVFIPPFVCLSWSDSSCGHFSPSRHPTSYCSHPADIDSADIVLRASHPPLHPTILIFWIDQSATASRWGPGKLTPCRNAIFSCVQVIRAYLSCLYY